MTINTNDPTLTPGTVQKTGVPPPNAIPDTDGGAATREMLNTLSQAKGYGNIDDLLAQYTAPATGLEKAGQIASGAVTTSPQTAAIAQNPALDWLNNIMGFAKGFSANVDRGLQTPTYSELISAQKGTFQDPYAERKDKEMRIQILDKVAARSNDYEKSDTFKNMNEAVTSYNQLRSLVNDAAEGKGFSDIALLTKFMKALDPRSVVRDTEFQTAANTGSLFQSLQNKLAGLVTGQKITDQQRRQILIAADAVMNANKENFGNFRRAQIAKAKQPLQYYKSIFPDLDTEADKLFIDLGESISTTPLKPTAEEQKAAAAVTLDDEYKARAQKVLAAPPGTYSEAAIAKAKTILGQR